MSGAHINVSRNIPKSTERLITIRVRLLVRFTICLTHTNLWELMGKPWSCMQFIKSCIVFYMSHENLYQYSTASEHALVHVRNFLSP